MVEYLLICLMIGVVFAAIVHIPCTNVMIATGKPINHVNDFGIRMILWPLGILLLLAGYTVRFCRWVSK